MYTHTSRVAALVAKYRPPMPILTLVVPRLLSDGLKWRLEGRGHARQCLMVRGLLPMLSAPGPSGDEVRMYGRRGREQCVGVTGEFSVSGQPAFRVLKGNGSTTIWCRRRGPAETRCGGGR